MKVVSLCPSNTEIMEFLGLTHLLVGVDDFSDWPEAVKSLPQLGPDLSINLDLVEELKPDLVLASLSVPGMEKNIEGLKVRNIPHIILNPQSLKDIENDLVITAEALNMPERGQDAAKKFRSRLEGIRLKGETAKWTPKLYWEWWPKPVFTPGRINWLTEISAIAGGENIFQDVDLASVQTNWDDVKSRNPDYICIAWVGVRKQKIKKELIINRPGWKELEAIKEDRLFILEEELYCRPSPRLLDGLEKLYHLIHE
ncbi:MULTISPECIES: cobalamin-binding protein [Mesobacillus]|uniref:ABC transporter substrate-binding protein n=2 Tax=Mesobacillus TaxID=2675231 RepID=A0A0D6Z7I0_9BACI|nr:MULTISPECIES: cobalamin-binding protein [Mesobacillus]KIY20548.1 ABC transporter substrate-binding protein [Mesobacillus subterraneus]MDQ0412763.1 iron complex transport system substrate-binding protein [Mesobacillus stamsii]